MMVVLSVFSRFFICDHFILFNMGVNLLVGFCGLVLISICYQRDNCCCEDG